MKKILNTRIKDMKAITLIALVITIVVLIILAAVAINLSLGNNGIFNRAKTGKKMYQNAEEYENEKIGKISNSIDEYTSFARAGISNINYSTDEQDTGLKWVDGSKIYQITYLFNNLNVKGYYWQSIKDVSSLKIKKLIYADANGTYTTNNYTGSLTKLFTIQLGMLNNNIIVYDTHSNNYPVLISDLTLQYTKTEEPT